MHSYLLVLFSEVGSVKLSIILYLPFMSFLLLAQSCKELGISQEMVSVFKVYKNQWNWRSVTGYDIKSDPQ